MENIYSRGPIRTREKYSMHSYDIWIFSVFSRSRLGGNSQKERVEKPGRRCNAWQKLTRRIYPKKPHSRKRFHYSEPRHKQKRLIKHFYQEKETEPAAKANVVDLFKSSFYVRITLVFFYQWQVHMYSNSCIFMLKYGFHICLNFRF